MACFEREVGVGIIIYMKDPAFLLYSSDFLTGTSDLTMEEKGQYITLLCLQHQKGRLSDKAIKLAVGNVEKDVMLKFVKDEEGLWYNKRLNQESTKRLTYKPKKIASATLAGLISSSTLNKKQRAKIKGLFDIEQFISESDTDLIKSNIKKWFTDLVNQMVNNIEDVNEDEINLEVKTEIRYPFESQEFQDIWGLWLGERKLRKTKSYTPTGEQAALHNLQKISSNNENTAIQIINQSIIQGWQGLFPLKSNNNGQQTSDQIKEELRQHYADRKEKSEQSTD